MKFLFAHQNFPGQYLHIIRHLTAQACHEILFLTEPNENTIPGVRKMQYRPLGAAGCATHRDARDAEQAMIRAEAVASAATRVKQLGFTPDIMIGHHGWGEMLNLPDIWPDAPMLGYFEFYYRTHGQDVGFDPEFPASMNSFSEIRAKNIVNLLALQLGGAGQTPTRFSATPTRSGHDARSASSPKAPTSVFAVPRPPPAVARSPSAPCASTRGRPSSPTSRAALNPIAASTPSCAPSPPCTPPAPTSTSPSPAPMKSPMARPHAAPPGDTS